MTVVNPSDGTQWSGRATSSQKQLRVTSTSGASQLSNRGFGSSSPSSLLYPRRYTIFGNR